MTLNNYFGVKFSPQGNRNEIVFAFDRLDIAFVVDDTTARQRVWQVAGHVDVVLLPESVEMI